MKLRNVFPLLISLCSMCGCRPYLEFISDKDFESLFKIKRDNRYNITFNYIREKSLSDKYKTAVFKNVENNTIVHTYSGDEYHYVECEVIEVARSELVHFFREYFNEPNIFEDNYSDVIKERFPNSELVDNSFCGYLTVKNYITDYIVQGDISNSVVTDVTKYYYSHENYLYTSISFNDFDAKSLRPSRKLDECFKVKGKDEYKYNRKPGQYHLKTTPYEDKLDDGSSITITDNYFELYNYNRNGFKYCGKQSASGKQIVNGEEITVTSYIKLDYDNYINLRNLEKHVEKEITCEHKYSEFLVQDKSDKDGCYYHFLKCENCGDCKNIAKCEFENGNCKECGHSDHISED